MNNQENKLIVGPWVGEFGWELFAWQAYIRALSRSYDHTTVISRPTSEALYGDFADEFVPYTPPSAGLADSFFMYNLDIKRSLRDALSSNNIKLTENTTVALPRRLGLPPQTHYSEEIQFGSTAIAPEYICFGLEKQKEYDYIFHMRDRNLREEDNWSVENWTKLRELLGDKKIGCIGTTKEAACIKGADDLRDIPLDRLFTILRNAACTFGPSSGPMHLSSLCGCPHVVWSIPQNKIRYEENWNPLQTKVLFTSEHDWHPTPEYIYKSFLQWCEK